MFNVRKRDQQITLTNGKSNRIKTGTRHELTLAIATAAANEASWLSATIADRNAGATSDTLIPGLGRLINPNERAMLEALYDKHELNVRLSPSRWHKVSAIVSYDTFKSVKTRLLDARLVLAVPTGRMTRNQSTEYCYQIIPEGLKALNLGWLEGAPKGEGVRNG